MAKQKQVINPLSRHAIRARFVTACDEIMRINHMRAAPFCKTISIRDAHLTRMRPEYGESGASPTIEQCSALCHVHGISDSWLLRGVGEMKAGAQEPEKSVLEERLSGVEKTLASVEKVLVNVTKTLQKSKSTPSS